MNSRYVIFVVTWIAGAFGTACAIHAFRYHFHGKAGWAAAADMLLWLAVVLLADSRR